MMIKVLKYCTYCCLLFTLPVMAFEGDYILEERFQAYLFKAKDGNVKAQFSVGEMYQRGRGTKASDEDALYWYLLAARQGHLKAAYKAAYIYLHSEIVPKSPRKAVPWLKLAANAGNPAAQYELGMIYGSGLAGRQDTTQALALLAKAKLAGYKPAVRAFDQVVTRFVKTKTKSSRYTPKPTKSAKKQAPEIKVAKARFRPDVTKGNTDPKQMILAKRWDSDNGPSTFLPSYITDCRDFKAYIECLSNKLTKQVSSTEVIYRIRTRISNIQNDGRFRLAYANKVLSATNKTGTRAVKIKTGWELSEHTMECSLDAGQAISCSGGSSKQVSFSAR